MKRKFCRTAFISSFLLLGNMAAAWAESALSSADVEKIAADAINKKVPDLIADYMGWNIYIGFIFLLVLAVAWLVIVNRSFIDKISRVAEKRLELMDEELAAITEQIEKEKNSADEMKKLKTELSNIKSQLTALQEQQSRRAEPIKVSAAENSTIVKAKSTSNNIIETAEKLKNILEADRNLLINYNELAEKMRAANIVRGDFWSIEKALDCKIGDILLVTDKDDNDAKKEAAQRVRNILQESNMRKERIDFVIAVFSYALGWNEPKAETKNEPLNPPQNTKPKITLPPPPRQALAKLSITPKQKAKMDKFVDTYNELCQAEKTDAWRTKRNELLNEYAIQMFSCVNDFYRMADLNIPPDYRTESMGNFFAVVVNPERGIYCAVPSLTLQYGDQNHWTGGMKEAFDSNYQDGMEYSNLMVIQPALFTRSFNKWEIAEKGKLELLP
jgi:hypothetical protein